MKVHVVGPTVSTPYGGIRALSVEPLSLGTACEGDLVLLSSMSAAPMRIPRYEWSQLIIEKDMEGEKV